MEKDSTRNQGDDKLIIRPFAYHDGIPSMRDSDIAHLYDLMIRDNTFEKVFFDGSIHNSDSFVQFIKSRENVVFVAFEETPVAFGWLNNFKYSTAQAHFCFFSEVWGRSEEIGRAMLDKIFSLIDLDMLIGMVPAFNEAAVRFAQDCGAVLIGEFPYGSVDGTGNSHPTKILYYVR